MTLRGESAQSFTTLDLLLLSLASGEAQVYKYGAAPSYIKRGGRVRRITSAALPVGLSAEGEPPERTTLHLEEDSFFLMISDGVADALDDEWLQDLLAGWQGTDPQALAAAVAAEGRIRRGTADDALVLAAFNVSRREITETFTYDVIPGMPKDTEYIAYEYFTKKFTRVHFASEETLTLEADGVRCWSLYPVYRETDFDAADFDCSKEDPDEGAYILLGETERYTGIGSREKKKVRILDLL
jgi:hypothetical protein